MKSFPFWTLCVALLQQSVLAQYYRNNLQKVPVIERNVQTSSARFTDETADAISSRSEQELRYSSEQPGNASSSQAADDLLNTTRAVSDSTTRSSTENATGAITTTTQALGNTSAPNSSSTTTTTGGKMSMSSLTPEVIAVNGSAPEEEEELEEVMRGKPSSTESDSSTTLPPETIYQKTVALINDTYTLSILLPVGAGIVFASTIIVTVAACRCMSRRCRRRRLRKKVLPDSVKNFRPSDKARLLTESSDEEF